MIVGFWIWCKWKIPIKLLPLIAAIIAFGFFEYQWLWHLNAHRHTLSTKERTIFKQPLKSHKEKALDIQIGCPYMDEKPCLFATQFIQLFGESGWKVEPFVQRLMLSKAQQGIVIYRRGGNKEYMQQHWDAGAYFAINESHLLAVQSAFQSIGIEPCGQTNPDLRENEMMIYFGQERENEGEPTNLTRSTEWSRGKILGPFPAPIKGSC